jgi:hypothetical protein
MGTSTIKITGLLIKITQERAEEVKTYIFNQSNDFAHHNHWNCNHGNYHCNNQNVLLPPQGHGYNNRNGFGNNENAPSNFGPPVTIINNYINNNYAAAPPPVKSRAIKRNFKNENDTDSDEY